jgi:hypothetical protein
LPPFETKHETSRASGRLTGFTIRAKIRGGEEQDEDFSALPGDDAGDDRGRTETSTMARAIERQGTSIARYSIVTSTVMAMNDPWSRSKGRRSSIDPRAPG